MRKRIIARRAGGGLYTIQTMRINICQYFACVGAVDFGPNVRYVSFSTQRAQAHAMHADMAFALFPLRK